MSKQFTTILTLIALALLLAAAGCGDADAGTEAPDAVQASEAAAHPSSCDGCPQAVVCGKDKQAEAAPTDSSAAAGCCPGQTEHACGGQ